MCIWKKIDIFYILPIISCLFPFLTWLLTFGLAYLQSGEEGRPSWRALLLWLAFQWLEDMVLLENLVWCECPRYWCLLSDKDIDFAGTAQFSFQTICSIKWHQCEWALTLTSCMSFSFHIQVQHFAKGRVLISGIYSFVALPVVIKTVRQDEVKL